MAAVVLPRRMAAIVPPRRFASRLTHARRTALASKRHLDYSGEDGASIFARQRHALERRAEQAMQAATDYKMPEESLEAREARAREKLRSSAGGRDYLVESEIQRALAAGEFDGLAGAGALPRKIANPDSYPCYLSYSDSTGYLEAIWGLDSSRG